MRHENVTRRLFRLLFRMMAYRPPEIDVPAQGVVLTDATVVNPGQARRKGQTLVVQGDRVASIEPSWGRAGDQACAGGYVLPGLIDMHVHIPPQIRSLIDLLFLAHGVTAIREVGDADGTTWQGRARVQQGFVPGPRIFTCGPALDGDPPFMPTSWPIRDATEAREVVAALAARGADFIKIHHKLSSEALTAIQEAAGDVGLRVVGHIPASVPFEQAGVWDVQHLEGLAPHRSSSDTISDQLRAWQTLTEAQIGDYVQVSADQGLRHTPTLITYDALARIADPPSPDEPAWSLLPRHYWAGIWDRENIPMLAGLSDDVIALMKRKRDQTLDIAHRLHRAGVPLHLGTDTAAVPFVVPGLSLLQELRLVVDAGLTADAAWAAGSRVAGASLGVGRLGLVQEGAPADLLIFDEDPTRDLDALSTLRGVIAQGRLYTRSFLDDALAQHQARFSAPLYDTLTTTLVRLGAKLMATN